MSIEMVEFLSVTIAIVWGIMYLFDFYPKIQFWVYFISHSIIAVDFFVLKNSIPIFAIITVLIITVTIVIIKFFICKKKVQPFQRLETRFIVLIVVYVFMIIWYLILCSAVSILNIQH